MLESENKPVTIQLLGEYLRAECYQPALYHLGGSWSHCGDTYCLEQTSAGFEAFYVERGQRSSDCFIEQDEATACRRFIDLLDRQSWSRGHCIAFTPDVAEIEATTLTLQRHGIQAVRNDIPAYRFAGDRRFRLFVFGRDLQVVHQLVASGALSPLSNT
jgi:hypothetical protein